MDDDTNTGDQGQANVTAVIEEQLSPIRSRLDRITEALSNSARDAEGREIRSRVNAQEYQVNQRLQAATSAVTRAEEAVASAYDGGDGAVIARAHRNLTEAIAARLQVNAEKQEFEQVKQDLTRRPGGASGSPGSTQPQQEATKDTTNLNSWKNKNGSWYGVDNDLTKAAHEIDKRVREAGVIPVGSPEYFNAIDRQMAQRFPEKFRTAPETGSGNGGGQQRPARGGRIPQSVLDGWERMGIDVKDDAALSRMVKNREVLASKGILPAEPQYGTVMGR